MHTKFTYTNANVLTNGYQYYMRAYYAFVSHTVLNFNPEGYAWLADNSCATAQVGTTIGFFQ